MIRKSDKDYIIPIKTVSLVVNGESTEIKKILKYNTDTDITNEIYPEGCIKLRVATNYDDSNTVRNVEGEQYPIPVINPESPDFVDFELTVTPYPSNSAWTLSSPTGFDLSQFTEVYYGEQTLILPMPTPDNIGFTQHTIIVTPYKGELKEVSIKFWVVKYAEGTIIYDKDWRFNDSLLDLSGTLQLNNTNASQNSGFIEKYVPGYRGDNALAAVYNPSWSLPPNSYQAVVDINNWMTTGLSVTCVARINRGGIVGFYDRSDLNPQSGQHFRIDWSYRLPSFIGLAGFNNTLPALTVGDRRDYSKFSHLAITLQPIDVTNHPNIIFIETPGTPFNSYNITYTSPNITYTKNYILNNYDSIALRRFFIMRSYMDGALRSEGFIMYNTQINKIPGNGIFSIEFTNAVDQNTTPDIIDRLSYYSGVLSNGDIESECSLIGILPGSSQPKPPQNNYNSRERLSIPDKTLVPITPILKGFVIDNRTVAIAGVFREWFLERQTIEFPHLIANEENYRNGYIQRYTYDFINSFSLWDLYNDYQPLIVNSFDDESLFSVDSQPVDLIGRWSTAIGLMRYPDLIDQTVTIETSVPDISQYAYLQLSTPMITGNEYVISWNGHNVTINYDKTQYASSIKVDQEGYLPSGIKRAYLGLWLGVSVNGTGGKFNPELNPDFNRTFHLIGEGSDIPVFTGIMVIRDFVDELNPHDGRSPLSIVGENVYEMDFTEVETNGQFQIYIPGIGYSHKFVIGNLSAAKCFWTHARGLYHHRAGFEPIEPPYTNWVYKNAHAWTWESDFVTDESEYKNIKTSDGTQYNNVFKVSGGSHFALIPHLATGLLFRETSGGWFDAADFDSRPMHLITVRDLIDPYLYFKNNFSDGQLNLPTSGNTIPDILDEAEHGLNIWRQCQKEDGAVSLWVETTIHEKGWGWESGYKYYLGKHCRRDSLDYAWSAAKFARALTMVGTDLSLKKAAIYTESAIKAFLWGINPNNTAILDFSQTKDGVIYNFTYTEDVSIVNRFIILAAASLFVLTKDPRFAEHITQTNYNFYFNWVGNDENSFGRYICTELLLDLKDNFPDLSNHYISFILGRANNWKHRQNQHPYYAMAWHPVTEWMWYNFISWGIVHPETRGKTYIYAWLITGDTSWKDQAILAMNYSAGCNAVGRTMTTGIGKVAPVHHLDGWLSEAETRLGIYEPTPGITPYTITGIDSYFSAYTGVTPYVYRPTVGARTPEQFLGVSINLLPGGFSNTITNNRDSVAVWLKANFPIYRQACDIEGYYVPGGEYTIWETVGGKAFMYACLLESDFTPDPSWAARVPAANRYDIEGLIFLP